MPQNISLLGAPSRVVTPFIKVSIGDYTFGVYQRTKFKQRDKDGFYQSIKVTYPNYVQSLKITKINGKVNTYDLNLIYPVTQNDDPNFFEKIFSSVSKSRKIVFSYGDMSLPSFVYRNEEAIITDVKTSISVESSTISYQVSAVSAANLLQSGVYTFKGGLKKPSDEIKKLLYNKTYGLQEIFVGMNNRAIVEKNNLIPGDDKLVQIETKTNISALDYLCYLVSCMVPSSSNSRIITQRDIYILTIIDDTTGEFGGTYFKIVKSSKDVENSDAYQIDIGFATKDIVKAFQINNNENYSIFYNWQKELNNEDYVYRLNDNGEWELEYAPIVSSKNNNYRTRVEDQTWWTKITEYPISAIIQIKGLLRPAILMTHVHLNVLFFGSKHISSGTYIVTQQQDIIDSNGYTTQLWLTRIAGEKEL